MAANVLPASTPLHAIHVVDAMAQHRSYAPQPIAAQAPYAPNRVTLPYGESPGTPTPGVPRAHNLAHTGSGVPSTMPVLVPPPYQSGALAYQAPASGWAEQAGALGVKGISGIGRKVLGLADRLDRAAYGRRSWFVGTLAGCSALGAFIDAETRPRAPLFTAIFTFVFTFGVFLLGVARLGALPSEEDRWSPQLAMRRIKDLLVGLRESIETFRDAAPPERWRVAGSTLVFAALIILAVRNVGTLATLMANEWSGVGFASIDDLDGYLLVLGIGLVSLGGVAWLRGRQLLRKAAKRSHLPPRGQETDLCAASLDLPVVINCRAPRELGKGSNNPVLEQFFAELTTWRRPRGGLHEDEYQSSLFRHLRRRMPEANPERERPFSATGSGNGRADLVVAGAILIEMKRAVRTTSSADRAVGQLRRYAESWSRGPIVLLLCETNSDVSEQYLRREVTALRERAPVVMVLLAG